jgi:phosphotransferase system  glucose/maltose/N-acetylglucosamine-specific IIC component
VKYSNPSNYISQQGTLGIYATLDGIFLSFFLFFLLFFFFKKKKKKKKEIEKETKELSRYPAFFKIMDHT